MKALLLVISSGLGTGYLPFAPGTWGTLVAALVYWFILPDNALLISLTALLLIIISVIVSGAAEKIYGVIDDSRIVIDEWAGYFVSVLFLPHTLRYAISAFVLFRIFDVFKPLGIRTLQSLPGGWGVTIDDIAAGVATNLLLQSLRFGVGR
jgi:phosphatidylglycerophosphatase A